MMEMPSRAESEVKAALAAVEAEDASLAEKIEMLMEMAMGLQTRPKTPDHLRQAILLYEKALELCPAELFLLRGRLHARLATALQAVPADDLAPLKDAQRNLEAARDILKHDGTPEEMAEIEMNLGLVLQSLASANAVPITAAIAAYQRALRTFDAKAFPKEYAILQNNLATAFLSIPFSDERAKMREALAVQAFQEGLKVVNIIDHPSEYAMLQNNLGNASQYVSSSHSVENCLRALDAYDEALKVRTRATTPAEYANTIANYANCLRNLPDDVARPEHGNRKNLDKALQQYREAAEIFADFGEAQKVGIVSEIIAEIEAELAQVEYADEPVEVIVGIQ
jgi:tetratricopeptide (TPR) repeat protein